MEQEELVLGVAEQERQLVRSRQECLLRYVIVQILCGMRQTLPLTVINVNVLF